MLLQENIPRMQEEIVTAIDANTLGVPQLEPSDVVFHVSLLGFLTAKKSNKTPDT